MCRVCSVRYVAIVCFCSSTAMQCHALQCRVRPQTNFVAGSVCAGVASSARSGRMVNDSTMPAAINAIDTTNGRFQLPVRSISQPPTTGLMIACKLEPGIHDPARRAGMLGSDIHRHSPHRAYRHFVEEKSEAQAQRRDRNRNIGYQRDRCQRQQRKQHAHADHHVALPAADDCILRSSRSVTMPPSQSPITPAKNTPEANSADLPNCM